MNEIVASADHWLPFVIGGVLLLVGRRLFWLLVATVGFLFTFSLVDRWMPGAGQPLHWLLAVLAGVVGGFLAVYARLLAVGLAGFLLGCQGVLWGLEQYGVDLDNWELLAVVAGGIVAAAVAMLVLEIALVVLSSVLGASLVAGATSLRGLPAAALFALLLIIGVAVQLRTTGERAPKRRSRG